MHVYDKTFWQPGLAAGLLVNNLIQFDEPTVIKYITVLIILTNSSLSQGLHRRTSSPGHR